jgi:uncharacterized membrane protein YcaP (DUF421 family)
MSAPNEWAETVLGLSQQAQNLSLGQICLRALVVYLVLLMAVRFGKKRFLSSATAFDAILVILIGSTAARAISGNVPFFGTLVAVFVLIALHWVISLISRDWPAFGALVKGHTTLLIKNGKVERQALKEAHMSNDDLEQDLREQGADDASQVKEARLERNGKLSVIKK